ncbi:MAG: hypothetical protein ABS37_00915 [Acidovorax sp. SCN 65-108]|nr:MAG: hypothetical protein ABS37_00915 [Acidovorax sp. SCN 65-108]
MVDQCAIAFGFTQAAIESEFLAASGEQLAPLLAECSDYFIQARYPDVAKEVRRLSGREPGASEDSLKAALKREQETARDLRAENLDLRKQLQAMASVNEALRQEVRILHATGHAKVVSFVPGAPTR